MRLEVEYLFQKVLNKYWNGKISWITPNDLSGYKFK